jgi:hypothetical protein
MSKIEVGSVAKCKHNILAVVTGIVRQWSGGGGYRILHYKGISFSGEPWASAEPMFVAANLNEYMLNYRCKY